MIQYAFKNSPEVWHNVPTLQDEISEIWGFFREFKLDYCTSDRVLHSDDLQKYIDDEWELEDFQELFKTTQSLEEYFGTKDQVQYTLDAYTKEFMKDAMVGLDIRVKEGDVLIRQKTIVQYHQPNSDTAFGKYWEELPVIADWYEANDDLWQRFLPDYQDSMFLSDEGYISQYLSGELSFDDLDDGRLECYYTTDERDVLEEELRDLRNLLNMEAITNFYECAATGKIEIRTI